MATKMTSGVLCRDTQACFGRGIVFFPKNGSPPVLYNQRYWYRLFSSRNAGPLTNWTPAEWNEQYQLYDENGKKIPPPKPGECFEVEIEL